jgi:hypothetical protein
MDEFPQISLLAWNRAFREITVEEAFGLYDGSWRFVDVE